MKNKKGFTLIEIIVCIVLIALVGTSTTVAFKLNKTKNNKENINNNIKTALDVYLNLYKDSDGDKYIDGINNGGKGLYIGLNTLVSEGLLEQDTITTLEKEYNKKEKDLKIFVANSIKTNDDELCGNNLIEYTFSWETDTTTPMYLCPKTTTSTGSDGSNESSDEVKNYIIKTNSKDEPTKLEMTNNNYKDHYMIYNYTPSAATSNEMITTKEDGLFYRENDEGNVYYYRGNIDNNYLSVGTPTYTVDGFRILSITDEYIKVIKEYSIDASNIKALDKITTEIEEYIYAYFAQPFSQYGNLNDFFKEIPFCTEVQKYTTYYDTLGDESCNTNEKRAYGLLSVNEAIYAGVPNKMYDDRCSFLYPTVCYGNVADSDNWLSSGSQTIMETKFTLTNVYPSKTHYMGLGTGSYGTYWTNGVLVETETGSLDLNTVKDAIRPVIVFDISKFTISGNGSKQSPYVLTTKKLN